MATYVYEKKAYFIGTWKDDAVTDNVIKQIATLTSLEKGRKVKLKLGPDGLTIKKSNLFLTKSLFDHIPLHDIFFMTVNQRHAMCLMCVIRDPVHKYTIVAFRCGSELIAGTFVQNFNAFKSSAGQQNVEFRKKDDGNWTLRERTNANARRELQQLFNSDTTPEQKPQINGGIFYKKKEKRNGDAKKANIYEQTPYIAPNPTVETEVYTEDYTTNRQIVPNTDGYQTGQRDDDSMSQSSDMSSIKSEVEALSAELKEVKYLLEKSTGISTQEHFRRAGIKERDTVNNNENYAIDYNRYTEPIVVDRNGSVVSSSTIARVDVPDYRSSEPNKINQKSSDDSGPEHLIAKSYRNSTDMLSEQDRYRYRVHSVGKKGVEMRKSPREPEYSVARHSNGFEAEDGVVYAAEKDANVNTVAYPSSTLPLARSNRGSVSSTIVSGPSGYVINKKGKPVRPIYGVVPSVVERPIEDIYSRPVLIRRDYVVAHRNRRPHSMYVSRPSDDYIYGSQIIMKEHF